MISWSSKGKGNVRLLSYPVAEWLIMFRRSISKIDWELKISNRFAEGIVSLTSSFGVIVRSGLTDRLPAVKDRSS
jgi:predicted DNA-binding transcriptional regulator